MKKIVLALLFSCNTYAASEIAGNFSYVGLGFQASGFSSGAMDPYFDDKYGNDTKKDLGGLYIDVNANIIGDIFIDGYADFSTRASSDIDTWKAGVGYALYRSPTFSLPVSCGMVNYSARRQETRSNSESAGYCKAGIKTQIAKHWLADVSYQYESVDEAKQVIGLKNVFQFGRLFGLVAGVEYADRAKSEYKYKFGLQFSFT